MTTYTVIECPICGKRRHFEGTTTKAKLVKAIAAHVLDAHSTVLPRESEGAIERSVRDIDVVEIDDPEVEAARWRRCDR